MGLPDIWPNSMLWMSAAVSGEEINVDSVISNQRKAGSWIPCPLRLVITRAKRNTKLALP